MKVAVPGNLSGMKSISSAQQNPKALEKAAKDFETILIGQFFRLMHSTVGDDGVIEKSFPRKMYEEMVQNEFAKEFTHRGGFQLHKVLIERFTAGPSSGANGRSIGSDGEAAYRMMKLERDKAETKLPSGPVKVGKEAFDPEGKEFLKLRGSDQTVRKVAETEEN